MFPLLTTLLDPLKYQYHELKGHFLLKNNLFIHHHKLNWESGKETVSTPRHSTPSFHCLQYVWKQKGTCAASRGRRSEWLMYLE